MLCVILQDHNYSILLSVMITPVNRWFFDKKSNHILSDLIMFF
jgi:hypothetical protein